MSWVNRSIAHCDECGFEWLPKGVPERCASQKCRKRTWNKNGDGKLGTESNLAETLEKVKAFKSRLPQVSVQERSERPKRPRARNVSIPKPEPLETPEIDDTEVPQWAEDQLNEMAEATEKLAANAVEMCDYKEYDDHVGEWFGCRLPVHGTKVKHQRGEKL